MYGRTERTLCFNGVDLDPKGTGGYLREPMLLSELQQVLAPAQRVHVAAERDVADGVAVERLDSAGWAMIVTEDARDRFEQVLAPLLALRRQQAGERYREPLIFRGEDVDAFRTEHGAGPGDVDPRQIPYYLTIVGSPRSIPFDFQCALDADHAVGRIDFDRDEDYAAYADHLIRHDNQGSCRSKRVAFFGPQNNDVLTAMSAGELVTPLVGATVEKAFELGSWLVEAGPPECDTRARLEHLMTGEDAAPLLFTAGHGACVSSRPTLRERLQGGLVCSDWQLPEPVSRDHCFFGEDLGTDADLSGRIIFNFACFSAGTPRFDRCRHPSGAPRELHPYPFTATLAREMMLRGALGVIGHVDQAFQHSFLWHDTVRGQTHLVSTLARLMRGYPVGYACEPMNRRATSIAAWILDRLFDPDPPTREELSLFKWLAWQDATNYALLGDPAARLFPGEAVIR